MVDFITKGVNSRTITAFFDTREAAEKARDSLALLGLARNQIQMTEGAPDAASVGSGEPGFWESLKRIFLPEEDRHTYAEGLRRGGYLLSAETDDVLYDRAMEVLDSQGAVDMDEREANWRTAGWQGYQADPNMALGTAVGAAEGMASPPIPVSNPTGAVGSGYALAERDTSHNWNRVRSYTTNPAADKAPFFREEPSNGVFGISERFSPATDAKLIAEHMEVIASEGARIGTVDHLDGDKIKLTKSASPDGLHHFVPLTSIDHVDQHVHLNKTASEVRASW